MKSVIPANLRDTFNLFQFFRKETGIAGLTRNLDLSTASPRQIYYAVHNRAPNSLLAAMSDKDHSPGRIFIAALESEEFRTNIVGRLMTAFPEKRRLIFVQIPGRTSRNLSLSLTGRYPSFDSALTQMTSASEEDFFLAIKHFVLEMNLSDTMYLYGSHHLATWEEWGALRLQDHVFTAIDDPVTLVILQMNNILRRVLSEDAPDEMQRMRAECTVDVLTGKNVIRLASRVLRDPEFVPPNLICHFLGDGTADQAIEKTVIHDLEVTSERYCADWCKALWGLDTQLEPAPEVVGRHELPSEDLQYIHSIVSEDLKYYVQVEHALRNSGSRSIVGHQLLKFGPPASIGSIRSLSTGVGTGVAKSILDDKQLVNCFESLGENCEFGLVQRRAGAEPLGLFRFSSAPLDKLLAALNARFDGMGHPDKLTIEISPNGREYMVLDEQFGIRYHAWVAVGEKEPAEIHRRECKRLPLLIQKLIEDLIDGEKLFVYHGVDPLTQLPSQCSEFRDCVLWSWNLAVGLACGQRASSG